MPRKHLIASGISEGRFDICIWIKLVRKPLLSFYQKTLISWKDGSRNRGSGRVKLSLSMVFNILMVVIALWATFDSWWKLINVVSSYYSSMVNYDLHDYIRLWYQQQAAYFVTMPLPPINTLGALVPQHSQQTGEDNLRSRCSCKCCAISGKLRHLT